MKIANQMIDEQAEGSIVRLVVAVTVGKIAAQPDIAP